MKTDEDYDTTINGHAIPSVYAPTDSPDYDGSRFTITAFGFNGTMSISSTSTETTSSTTTTSIEVPPSAEATCTVS